MQIVNLILAVTLVAAAWRLTVWLLQRSLMTQPALAQPLDHQPVSPQRAWPAPVSRPAVPNRPVAHVHFV